VEDELYVVVEEDVQSCHPVEDELYGVVVEEDVQSCHPVEEEV